MFNPPDVDERGGELEEAVGVTVGGDWDGVEVEPELAGGGGEGEGEGEVVVEFFVVGSVNVLVLELELAGSEDDGGGIVKLVVFVVVIEDECPIGDDVGVGKEELDVVAFEVGGGWDGLEVEFELMTGGEFVVLDMTVPDVVVLDAVAFEGGGSDGVVEFAVKEDVVGVKLMEGAWEGEELVGCRLDDNVPEAEQ